MGQGARVLLNGDECLGEDEPRKRMVLARLSCSRSTAALPSVRLCPGKVGLGWLGEALWAGGCEETQPSASQQGQRRGAMVLFLSTARS